MHPPARMPALQAEMKNIHQAPVRLFVPEGFSGWWCERCEKPVDIEDALGSPARCPKCHKATAVWVPPSEPRLDCREPREEFRPERKFVTRDEGKFMFEDMLRKIEDGTAGEEEKPRMNTDGHGL